MVQRPGGQGGAGRKLGRTRLHGNQTLRLCHLGKDARRSGPDVQGNGPSERLLPAVHPQVVLLQGSAPRGGICQRMRRSDPLPAQERPRRQGSGGRPGRQVGRGADRTSDVGDDHLEHL